MKNHTSRWLSFHEAVDLISQPNESFDEAWFRLRDRIVIGAVRTHSEIRIEDFRDGSASHVERDSPIPITIFSCGEATFNHGLEESILFTGWLLEEQIPIYISLIGASICRADINDMLPLPYRSVQRSFVGRPPSIWWADFAEELAFYIFDKGPPDRHGNGQGIVVQAVLDRMAERGCDIPDRSSITTVVQKVLDRIS